LAGSSGCTPVNAWSVSSNIVAAPGLVCLQERDAIDQHHHQQQSAAAVLARRHLPSRHELPNRQIRSLVLYVDLVGSRPI
jgi:hypothetical protein